MKLTLLIFLSLVILSCSPFQYFTLSGNNISKNQQDEFVAENDTLKIMYRFNGYHGPIKITIYNKTNEPIEINWKKSALIFNDRAMSYYSPNLYLDGTARTDTSRFSGILASTVKADILVNEPNQYIPPRSSVVKVPFNLPITPFRNNQLTQQKMEVYNSGRSFKLRYHKMDFRPEKSPANFRSYLRFSIGQIPQEFALEHSFYVSEVWQSESAPENFPGILLNKPDRFYLRSQILTN